MKHLLQDAANEIEELRRRNEILSAKVEVIDVFAAALFADTRQTRGASPDVVWALRKKITELETGSA